MVVVDGGTEKNKRSTVVVIVSIEKVEGGTVAVVDDAEQPQINLYIHKTDKQNNK